MSSLPEAVKLIDRFLDHKLKYGFEWDDFISWEHPDPNIEALRDRIADTEPLFFSPSEMRRQEGIEILKKERNRIAALLGMESR